MVWKLLTAIIVGEIYGFLDTNSCLLLEQKGRRRKPRETNDLLLIHKTIMKKL